MNQVILIGNVGKDPETTHTQNGKQVTKFSIATQESKDLTEWHNIVTWEKTAQIVEQYVRKGSKIAATGRISTRQWEDKDGNKRYTTEIIADRIELLSKSEVSVEANSQAVSSPAPTMTESSSTAQPADDLPF